MEVSRPRIVAKPRPFAQHRIERRRSKVKHSRPEMGKAQKVFLNRSHRCLLQHHLAEPDPIGIGMHTLRAIRRRNAPGQIAGVAIIPGEHGFGIDWVGGKEGHGGWI